MLANAPPSNLGGFIQRAGLSANQCLVCLPVCMLLLAKSSLVYNIDPPLIDAFIHASILSCVHSFIHSRKYVLLHSSFFYSWSYYLIHGIVHVCMESFINSFTFIQWCVCVFIQYSSWFSAVERWLAAVAATKGFLAGLVWFMCGVSSRVFSFQMMPGRS